jgi:hypothetical protein
MSGDAVSRLERAAALLDRGLLTASEFALVKSNILEEIDKRGKAATPTPSAAPTPSAVAANKAKRHACAAHPVGGRSRQEHSTPSAHEWWILHDVLSMHVMQWMDVGTALRCRAVCSWWRRAVAATSSGSLQPLEAGLPAAEMDAGLQEEHAVRHALMTERELWADDMHVRRFTKLANDLEQQHGLNSKMRQVKKNTKLCADIDMATILPLP